MPKGVLLCYNPGSYTITFDQPVSKVILGFWSFDWGNVAAFAQDFTLLNTDVGKKTTGLCSTYGITTATTCTLLYSTSDGILMLDGPITTLTFVVAAREVTFGWMVI